MRRPYRGRAARDLVDVPLAVGEYAEPCKFAGICAIGSLLSFGYNRT